MFGLGLSPLAAMQLVAGARAVTPMGNGRANKRVVLTIGATVQISVAAATAIRNRGSVLALFNKGGIDENGVNKWEADMRALGYVSESYRPSASAPKRLTSVAVGTYQLEEQVVLGFEHPFAANPRETQFRELLSNAALRVFADYTGDASKILQAGGATVAITAPYVRVQQVYDQAESSLPLFIPQVEEVIVPIGQAVTDLAIPLGIDHTIRALTIQQDTATVGEVADIISKLQLRGDNRFYIGTDGPVPFSDLVAAQNLERGGDVVANGAYLHIDMQEQGRLSKTWSKRQDNNLRLVVSAQPSVVAGAGASSIRILVHKLVRDTRVSGERRVTAPELPAELLTYV